MSRPSVQEPLLNKVKKEFPNFKTATDVKPKSNEFCYINARTLQKRQSDISIITIHSDSTDINNNIDDESLLLDLNSADQRYLDEILKMVNFEDIEHFNEYATNIIEKHDTAVNTHPDDGTAILTQSMSL